MQLNNQRPNETLAILQRLTWWRRVMDDLETCPIEDLHFSNDGISFFIDARRAAEQFLRGFPTAARQVQQMTFEERESVARYLVRLHKQRFASAVRGMGAGRRCGSAKVNVVGDEIAFDVPLSFVCKALEIYQQKTP
jgi:hypothetical protein